MKITKNYVFFWGEYPSQWYKAKMIIDGIEYSSAEQYMMHQKAVTFNDQEIAAEIMKTEHPSDQKKLGRKIKGFEKSVWDRVCLAIVYKGNYAKFIQNEDLKDELLTMGRRIFVEASPEDPIWGIGMHENDKGIEDPSNWGGNNLLGQVITLVKQQIQSENE